MLAGLIGLTPVGPSIADQPAAAPDQVTLTITDIEISQDGTTYTQIPIVSGNSTLDTSSPPPTIACSEQPCGSSPPTIPAGEYRALQMIISGGSWSANWSANNRSPCTGDASGSAGGPISFGGNSLFYFKTPDLGGNTRAYYLAHPPVTGYIGDVHHPFLLPSPVTVVANNDTTVNLTIDVTDVLTCNSVSAYNRSATGNSPPARTLTGPGTALSGVAGVVVNSYADEVAVSNGGDNSVTFYDRIWIPTTESDIPPNRALIGPATLFNQPTGVALSMNQSDHTQDALFVANRGNNSIGVFTWSSSGNSAPQRAIGGIATGLNDPTGLAVDSANSELVVANGGNDSLTFYSLAANQNTVPLHLLAGSNTGLDQPSGVALHPDPTNPAKLDIAVANQGNDSVTIYDRNGLLASLGQLQGGDFTPPSGTSVTGGSTLTLALNGDNNRTIIFPASVTQDGITVAAQIQLLVRALSSSVPAALKSAYANFTASYDNDLSHQTMWHYLLQSGAPGAPSSVVVQDGPTAESLFLTTNAGAVEVDGSNLSPIAMLVRASSDDKTQLDSPVGVAVLADPSSSGNDQLLVANGGTGTITVYDWNAVIAGGPKGANLDPTVLSGLNGPKGLYLDSGHNEIWVPQGGAQDQVAMTFQPSMVPAVSNASASGSALSGNYYVMVYGVDLGAINLSGFVIPTVMTERGSAKFDPSADPSNTPSTFSLIVDTELGRQVLQPNCLNGPDVGVTQTAYYDVNADGSFNAVFPGTGGTIQGAYLPDGSAFVGSIADSSDHLRIIYGVRAAGNVTPYLTLDGTVSGQPAFYGYASYRNDLWSVGRFLTPPGTDLLRYLLGIGMAETDASAFMGASGDANFVSILNPMGDAAVPSSGGSVYEEGFGPLTLAPPNQAYNNSSPGGGKIQNPTDGVTGALTADGATLIYARDTSTVDANNCPTDLGFGMGLRQLPAGTYTAASFQGTYSVAAFGDQFDSASNTTQYQSSALSVTFDGAGHAQLEEIDNKTGMVSVIQAALTYQVHQRNIPASGGGTQFKVDVIDLYDRTKAPYASALIGANGRSLIYFQVLNPQRAANPIRQLGLALYQHS